MYQPIQPFSCVNRAIVMLVTSWWCQYKVGLRGICKRMKNISDRSGQIRHQHLKLVTNRVRLLYLSPISILSVKFWVICETDVVSNICWWQSMLLTKTFYWWKSVASRIYGIGLIFLTESDIELVKSCAFESHYQAINL